MKAGELAFLGVIGLVAVIGGSYAVKFLNPAGQKVPDKSKAAAPGSDTNADGTPTTTLGDECSKWKASLASYQLLQQDAQSKMAAALKSADSVCSGFSTAECCGSANDAKEKQSCLDYIKTGNFYKACSNCSDINASQNASYLSRANTIMGNYASAKKDYDDYTGLISTLQGKLEGLLTQQGVTC